MPGRQEPTKDGANTEMPRGAVSRRRSGDVRMGEPAHRDGCVSFTESIGKRRQTGGIETSQYPEEEKIMGRNLFAPNDSVSSGERTRKSPNRRETCFPWGLWDVPHEVIKVQIRRSGLERPTVGGKSPVAENVHSSERIPSTAGHEKSRGKQAGPSAKAKYFLATDSEAVP